MGIAAKIGALLFQINKFLCAKLKMPRTASGKKTKRSHAKGKQGAAGVTALNGKLDEQDRKKLKEAANKTKANYSIEELQSKVDECVDTFNYELAVKFCERILFIDKNNAGGWEKAGSLYIELGNLSKAEQCLRKAIELNPNRGASKYLSLAQILHGTVALQLYRTGAEIIGKEIDGENEDGSDINNPSTSNGSVTQATVGKEKLRDDLCGIYCAIGELYMTDLCDEDDAQAQCEAALQRAVEVGPGSAEAHQTMASYLLTVGRSEEARVYLERSLSFWLPQLKARVEEEDESEDGSCPLSYESRLHTAEMLTEVGEYRRAGELLELLLDEDDEVVQVWFMMGLCCKLQADRLAQGQDREGDGQDREGERQDREGEGQDREGEGKDREGERQDHEGEDEVSELRKDALQHLSHATSLADKMGGWESEDMGAHVQQLIEELSEQQEPMDDDDAE